MLPLLVLEADEFRQGKPVMGKMKQSHVVAPHMF
jgi:hypothetical protein